MSKKPSKLTKVIKERLPERYNHLRILKEEELKALTALNAIRKRRIDLEKKIREEEDFVERDTKRLKNK